MDVRARVKLINPMDEAMVRRGYKRLDRIRRIEVDALIRPRAVHCSAPSEVVDRLGLNLTFRKMMELDDGGEIEVDVAEPALFDIMGRMVYEELLVFGEVVSIGRTALASTDLVVDRRTGRLKPNPDHPDYPVIKIRRGFQIIDQRSASR
jgi:hypothetical protein